METDGYDPNTPPGNYEPAESGGDPDYEPAPLLRRMHLRPSMSEKQLLMALIRQQEMATELIAEILITGQGPGPVVEPRPPAEQFRMDYELEDEFHDDTFPVLRLIEKMTDWGGGYTNPTAAQVDVILRAKDDLDARKEHFLVKSKLNHPSNRFRTRRD